MLCIISIHVKGMVFPWTIIGPFSYGKDSSADSYLNTNGWENVFFLGKFFSNWFIFLIFSSKCIFGNSLFKSINITLSLTLFIASVGIFLSKLTADSKPCIFLSSLIPFSKNILMAFAAVKSVL